MKTCTTESLKRYVALPQKTQLIAFVLSLHFFFSKDFKYLWSTLLKTNDCDVFIKKKKKTNDFDVIFHLI